VVLVHESVVALSRSSVHLYVRFLEALTRPVSRAQAQAFQPTEALASSSEAVAVPMCSVCNCQKAAMHPCANTPTAILHAQLGCVYRWQT
jgi:hypothetical protein